MAEVNATLLKKEIEREIRNLESLQPGSNEHSVAVESLNKLYRLKMDDDKDVSDYLEKHNQIKEMKKDRNIKIGIAFAELIVPLIFYGIWMKRGFKFEKDGTFTSSTFRSLWSRFKPAK